MNPDPNELNKDVQVADPTKENYEDHPETSEHKDEAPVEDIPILGNWDRPVKRPDELSPETKARLKAMSEMASMDPVQKARQMMDFRPDDYITPTLDTEDPSERSEMASPASEEEHVAPKVTMLPKRAKMAPKPQNESIDGIVSANPNEPDDGFNRMQMEQLGIKDNDFNDNPVVNPDVPLHTPDGSKPQEIKNAENLTIESMKEQLEEIKNEEPQAGMIAVPQDQPEEEEDVVELIPVNSNQPEVKTGHEEEEVVQEISTTEQEEKEEEIILVLDENESTTTEEQVQEPVTKEETTSTVENTEEDVPVLSITEPTDGSDIINHDDLDIALDELPESTLATTPADKDEEDQDTREESDQVATTIPPREALDGIVTLQDMAVFGEEPKSIFTSQDLDENTDTGISPSHLIMSNMTTDERIRYVVQTNSEAMRQQAAEMFGVTSNLYRVTFEGLSELNDALLNSQSYPHRANVSQQQFGNPAVTFNKETLQMAHDKFHEKHPNKTLKMSRPIIVPKAGPDGKDLKIDDKFATKDVIFSRMSENATARISDSSSAKIAAMLINGLRTVHLYNSGFHVNLTAPRLDLLSRYYNTMTDRMQDYGRTLGQFAFLPVGVETRAALLDMFEACVEQSNLENFREPGVLRQAVSVLDIPVIAWALASLMYPRGVDIEYLCYNNDNNGKRCRHVEKVRVDVNSMRYNNWSLLNADAITYVTSKETRTLEDLRKYRAEYLKTDGTTIPITKDGEWQCQIRIPTAFEAEEKQRGYIAQMVERVQLSNSRKSEEYFRAKYLAAFVPFVSKLQYIDPTTKKILSFEDPLALERSLDNLQLLEDVLLPEKLMNYIKEKTITHICFTHHKCPQCGKYPPDAVDGLVPCDPEYAFFVWATARLQQ